MNANVQICVQVHHINLKGDDLLCSRLVSTALKWLKKSVKGGFKNCMVALRPLLYVCS